MEPLEPPDTHYLLGAVGWLELGNLGEAKEELERLGPARQMHPDVLEVRWLISTEEQKWGEGLQIARALLHADPERASGWLHQAYALRRVPDGGIQKARDALLPAYEKFPKESTISYNLSCYACQLGQLEDARLWLKRALAVSGKDRIKRMALSDSDLEPLWREIEQM
jgi:Flp pilus assembly protein TadD